MTNACNIINMRITRKESHHFFGCVPEVCMSHCWFSDSVRSLAVMEMTSSLRRLHRSVTQEAVQGEFWDTSHPGPSALFKSTWNSFTTHFASIIFIPLRICGEKHCREGFYSSGTDWIVKSAWKRRVVGDVSRISTLFYSFLFDKWLRS